MLCCVHMRLFENEKGNACESKVQNEFSFLSFFFFTLSLSEAHIVYLKCMLDCFVHTSHNIFKPYSRTLHAAGSWRLTLWCLCHDTNVNCAMWKCSSAFYVCSTKLTRRERALICHHKSEDISVWNESDFKESTQVAFCDRCKMQKKIF